MHLGKTQLYICINCILPLHTSASPQSAPLHFTGGHQSIILLLLDQCSLLVSNYSSHLDIIQQKLSFQTCN